MPKPMDLVWNKARGDVWAELHAVDLESPHFNGMQGVYVVWHGGKTPETVRVGQGDIRQAILSLRADQQVQAFKPEKLYVTWAKVDKIMRDGVERFIAESLQPLVKTAAPASPPVE